MRTRSHILAVALTALALSGIEAQAQNVLSPADTVIAVDGNRNNPGTSNTGAEGPASAFDENPGAVNTKWFTGGREFSGAIITLAGGPASVKSLQFTTANDSSNRDPISFQLYGMNGTPTSPANGSGLEDAGWTFVGSGNTGFATAPSVATARNTNAPPVDITNANSFSSYKVVFPALRLANDAGAASNPGGMQVNEIRMFNAPAGGGTNVALNPTLIVPIDQTDSAYPPAENPRNAVDGTNNKYLNFGREGSGMIITPAAGPTTVGSLQIRTANDSPNRDPASFELYGRNGPISSIDNSEGTAEVWTLIASGALNLPGDPAVNTDQRNVDGPIVAFANNTSYTSYKLIFPTVKAAGANSMQLGEVRLFTVPEPSSAAVVGLGAIALLKRRRRA